MKGIESDQLDGHVGLAQDEVVYINKRSCMGVLRGCHHPAAYLVRSFHSILATLASSVVENKWTLLRSRD